MISPQILSKSWYHGAAEQVCRLLLTSCLKIKWVVATTVNCHYGWPPKSLNTVYIEKGQSHVMSLERNGHSVWFVFPKSNHDFPPHWLPYVLKGKELQWMFTIPVSIMGTTVAIHVQVRMYLLIWCDETDSSHSDFEVSCQVFGNLQPCDKGWWLGYASR